jgi:hypothetical protein
VGSRRLTASLPEGVGFQACDHALAVVPNHRNG